MNRKGTYILKWNVYYFCPIFTKIEMSKIVLKIPNMIFSWISFRYESFCSKLTDWHGIAEGYLPQLFYESTSNWPRTNAFLFSTENKICPLYWAHCWSKLSLLMELKGPRRRLGYVMCWNVPNFRFCTKANSETLQARGKSKKAKVHPRTGHEGPGVE